MTDPRKASEIMGKHFDEVEPDEFEKRYGYPMPENVHAARADPRTWLDPDTLPERRFAGVIGD